MNSKIWKVSADTPSVLWIEHETGPEILGTVADLCGIASAVAWLWTNLGTKIGDNVRKKKRGKDTDRYYGDVLGIRAEARRSDPGGQLTHVFIVMLPVNACVLVRRERRHSSAGANPARQLSLQPVAVGADDGGNDIG